MLMSVLVYSTIHSCSNALLALLFFKLLLSYELCIITSTSNLDMLLDVDQLFIISTSSYNSGAISLLTKI